MSIESEQDLIELRRIGRVVARALRAMQEAVAPGVTTSYLDRIGAAQLRQHGARSAPKREYGFPTDTIVCVNDELVHGIPSDRVVAPGDLITFDVTTERGGYVADAAVTVGVGPSTTLQRKLIACSERALTSAIGIAQAGRRIRHIGREVQRVTERAGVSVVKPLTGHGVGRAVHEWPSIPNYDAPCANDRLDAGQVITIEPIISAGTRGLIEQNDGWTVSTSDGAPSSHHEHSIVITDGAPIVLTAAA
ncbi:MAG: type I methionyl aminopeptidase [Gemmatimonadetes bacterium]|nr:type I methionyl aminopeptidase [Gemmatimonadota bacterium]|tara:strand:- start:2722 stop:3468 length:747 start_codon:yes stop_codon:yes gene_type:complete